MPEIKPLELHQIEAVKRLIITVCHEIFQVSEERIWRYDDMADLEDVRSHYFDNNGTFLVLIDTDKVVGSGAIRRLDNQTCELKRMWLLKEYRGKGFGKQIAQRLLDFAKTADYRQVRLDLLEPQKQAQAMKLYRRLGFDFIERYNNSPGKIFMEKIIYNKIIQSSSNTSCPS
jgi:putative acetyltransferase